MKRMNRREFLGVLGSASAVSMAGMNAFAANNAFSTLDASSTMSLHVTGIMMLDLENPQVVRLGFPKAAGHTAKLSIVPQSGTKRFLHIKGNGTVEGVFAASADAKTFPPEMVRAKELYGNAVKSRIDRCPSIITIPAGAIRSMSAAKLTKNRWTFVRADNNKEVDTFRPRQVAETIRFDLSSAGILKLDGGKVNIPLDTVRELWFENTPDSLDGMGAGYPDHFAAYFPYIERPAALDFEVIPRKVGGTSAPTPKMGHHFMMLTDDYTVCAPIAVP